MKAPNKLLKMHMRTFLSAKHTDTHGQITCSDNDSASYSQQIEFG